MTARAALAFAIATAIGCGGHKDRGGAGAASPDVAALWAMAPQGADAGFVVSGRAMSLFEGALVRLEALGKSSPAIAQAVDTLEQSLGPSLAGGRLARWSDIGLAPGGGLAFFHLPGDRTLSILKIADRDKFVTATHARKDSDGDHLGRVVCRTIAAHYQCASDPAVFDAPRAEPDGHRAASLHGDVEAWAAKSLFPAAHDLEWTGDLEIAATIEPGALMVRAHAPVRGAAITRLATKPIMAQGADRAAGLIAIDVSPAIAQIPPSATGPIPDALRSLAGPVTIVAPGGGIDPDARVMLRDPAPIKKLLAECDEIVPPGAGITATPAGDGCHLSFRVSGMVVDVDAWVDDHTLRMRHDRKAAAPAGAPVPATPLGAELGNGTWTATAWGRGTIIDNLVPPGAPPEMTVYAVPFFAISELGLGVRVGDGGIDLLAGVRTIWDDPEDVIAALAPIIAKGVRGESITADVNALAARFPNSPYAANVRAGEGGLMLPVALAGMVSAIVAPLVLDYRQAAPGTEGDLQLDNLQALSKRYFYAHDGAFPTIDVGPTPATACCARPGTMCQPDAADWTGNGWEQLGFHMRGDSFRFQYSYKSDGHTVTAIATSDLDCDPSNGGTSIVLHGTIVGGEPTFTVERTIEK